MVKKSRHDTPGHTDHTDHTETPAPDTAANRSGQRARRAFFWVIQYWRELFNFRFDKYMVIQVIPGVYGLSLAGIALGLLYLSFEAFLQSSWRGAFYLFIASPLAFLVIASILRAMLEFYMVIFQIAEDVDELIGIRDTVDKLGGISQTVDEMAALTQRIPFWNILTSRKVTRSKIRKQSRNKRTMRKLDADDIAAPKTSPSPADSSGKKTP